MALPASRSRCRATITSALGDFRKRRRLGRDSRSVAKTRCSSSLNASTSPRSALRTRISTTCAWARWEGIVTTETLHDTSFAAHLQPALSDYAGLRCRFGRPRPLNPFAACRDQRTNGRKGRNGITRGKPQHSAGGFIPGTKTVVIGACAPIHPRVGPAVRPDVSIRADLLLFFRPWPRAAMFFHPRIDGHDVVCASAIDPLADASDGGRALADHAADVRFCTDDFI